MESVLEVYKRAYNPRFPVICMDEASRQLVSEITEPIPARSGKPVQYDYEYKRMGTCSIFLASEPLAGWRMARVRERRTRIDWAAFIQELSESRPQAEKITLVMDNLNTHSAGSLYEAFPPEQAKRLSERFEFVYTPKHGSWLNIAEIELNVLATQCFNRRIAEIDVMRSEVEAWAKRRNEMEATVNWQFTTEDARIKLRRLYPTIQE